MLPDPRTADWSQWILTHRPGNSPLTPPPSPWKANAAFQEWEPIHPIPGALITTLLLANRECPWRCLMCDLWKHTLPHRTPVGAIPSQIQLGLMELPPWIPPSPDLTHSQQWVKLYNSGSFFDPAAIPPEDYPSIARLVHSFQKIIVECHPKLIDSRCLRFKDLLPSSQLEIAIGLETVHEPTLQVLNKRFNLTDASNALSFATKHSLSTRCFLLVQPPFLTHPQDAIEWTLRSQHFAFQHGASTVTLIPTRPGNGALEALARLGHFSPPSLSTLEQAFDLCLTHKQGTVLVDLWDLDQFSTCPQCFPARQARLAWMNQNQAVIPPILCDICANP